MFGLRQQIGGYEIGARRVVGDDHDLARPGDGIDVYGAVYELLRGGGVLIAGADDLVHARYRLGPVRQSGDGLRAAGGVDLEEPQLLQRRRDHRILLESRGRSDDDASSDARDPGRNGGHHPRRRLGRAAARDVQPDDFKRADSLAQSHAVLAPDLPVASQLMFVVTADVGARLAHRGDQIVVNLRGQFLDSSAVDAQGFGRELYAVEARRKFDQRRVAAPADIADDGVNAGHNLVVQSHAPAQDFFQLRALFNARAGQLHDFDHKTSVNDAISAPTSTRFR